MIPDDSKTIKDLGVLLLSLIASEPHNRKELREWVKRSREALVFTSRLAASGIGVPELIYHYLSDADIRLKDPRYAGLQMPRIKKIALLLSEGVIQGSDEI